MKCNLDPIYGILGVCRVPKGLYLLRYWPFGDPKGRGKKNVRNPEYSGFRLFGRIEWVPPLKIKKLLRVMRRTGKQP